MSSDMREALADRIGEYRAAGSAAVLLEDRAPRADRLDDLLEAADGLNAARETALRSAPRWPARMLAALSGRGPGRDFDHARVHDEAVDILRAGSPSGARLAAIDHAIVLLSAAARSAAGHRNQPYYLSDLGTAWLDRFMITGRAPDLAHSVAAHAGAVGARGPGAEDRAGLLANYSAARLAQFGQGRDRAHLQDAIATARMATDLARSAAARLGAAPPALAVSGPDSERAAGIRLARLASLSRLQAALLARHEEAGAEADLDEAVHLARETASLVPAGDAARARYQDAVTWLVHKQARGRRQPATAGRAAGAGVAAVVRPLPAG